jgi:hypothetical protein
MRGLGKEAVTEQGRKVLMVIGEAADESVCKIVKMGEVDLKGMQNEFIRSDIGTKDFTAIRGSR